MENIGDSIKREIASDFMLTLSKEEADTYVFESLPDDSRGLASDLINNVAEPEGAEEMSNRLLNSVCRTSQFHEYAEQWLEDHNEELYMNKYN